METTVSSAPPYTAYSAPLAVSRHPRILFWGAILAGAVAALGMQILLMMLGAGLGFAVYNPLTNDNPIADFGAGAAVIHGVAAVISLWVGGWVAGRFTGRAGPTAGALHGFMVWCLATVALVVAVSGGAGWALGDLSKIVGGGLSMAGKPLAAAAGAGGGELAKQATDRTQSMLSSFTDEALGDPAGKNPASQARTKRNLGLALSHLAEGDAASMTQTRDAAVRVLVEDQGMNEADARKTVDGWVASYQQLKTDLDAAKQKAELKAREAADKAAKALSLLSLLSFGAFVIGAVSATIGGKHGGVCGFKRTELIRE